MTAFGVSKKSRSRLYTYGKRYITRKIVVNDRLLSVRVLRRMMMMHSESETEDQLTLMVDSGRLSVAASSHRRGRDT